VELDSGRGGPETFAGEPLHALLRPRVLRRRAPLPCISPVRARGLFDPLHLGQAGAHRAHCRRRGRRPHGEEEREAPVLDFDGEGLSASVIMNNTGVPPRRHPRPAPLSPHLPLSSPRAADPLLDPCTRMPLRHPLFPPLDFCLTIFLFCWRRFLMCTVARGRKKCICLPLLESI
jgi:hypothetical protein